MDLASWSLREDQMDIFDGIFGLKPCLLMIFVGILSVQGLLSNGIFGKLWEIWYFRKMGSSQVGR